MVTTIKNRTTVPSRLRALSASRPVMPMSTPVVPLGSTEPMWRDRLVFGGTSVIPGVDVLLDTGAAETHHNSIASVAEAGNAPAKDGFYAAKQAAPPRGIPR